MGVVKFLILNCEEALEIFYLQKTIINFHIMVLYQKNEIYLLMFLLNCV